VALWNQHEGTLLGLHRTNNVSEGWHNRFNLLVGRHHPDLYSLMRVILKEQQEVEGMLVGISLGKTVRAATRRKYASLQVCLLHVLQAYDTYKVEGRLLEYLENIGCNISLG